MENESIDDPGNGYGVIWALWKAAYNDSEIKTEIGGDVFHFDPPVVLAPSFCPLQIFLDPNITALEIRRTLMQVIAWLDEVVSANREKTNDGGHSHAV